MVRPNDPRPNDPQPNRRALPEARLHAANVLDKPAVAQLLLSEQPDLVFHLAAQASPTQAWADPEETYRTNVLGQLNLLEGVRAMAHPPRVLVVSSNEVYGAPSAAADLPIAETYPLQPNNPYAVSKAAQDLMGQQYYLSHGLPVVRVRPFNHLGPGQSDAFVASAFARQVAEAEAGLRPPVMQVGNLAAQRDFSDVRDIVRGYYLALTIGVAGEVYNLCSGAPTAVQGLLDFFRSQSTLDIKVEQDLTRYRPSDVPCVYGDNRKARAALGWQPSIPLQQTLAEVLEYWRAQVRADAHPS